MSVVGSMDQAYFVGRKEVVDWINETLKLNIGKVEQTASGAVACQLLDAIFPGKVPLHKVNWDAKQEYEFINNYKILQSCFNKLKIDKNIEVEKLIRAKYQDNLEFMQWFKRYYELNRPAADYDPVAQRAGKGGPAAPASGRADVLNGAPKNTPSKARAPVSVIKKAPRARSVDDKENATHKPEAGTKQAPRTEAARKTVQDPGLQEKLDLLSQENTQLLTTVEGLEKERDFYFEKLTLVEELLQERQSEGAQGEASELIEKILKILYATGAAGEQGADDEVREA